jgi:hypothetical protein
MSHRMQLRKWLAGFGIVISASTMLAQDVQQSGGIRIGRPIATGVPCPPQQNCPAPSPIPLPIPGVPSTMPGAPGQQVPSTMPSAPGQTAPTTPGAPTAPSPNNVATAPPAGGGFEASLAPSAGTRSGSSIAPNLMGDILGARSVQLSLTRDLTMRFPNSPLVQNGVVVAPGQGLLRLAPRPGEGGSTYNGGPYQQLARIDSFTQQLLAGQASISPVQAQTAQAVLQAAFSGRQLTAAQIAALPANIRAQLPQLQNSVNGEITRATKGFSVQNITVGPVSGQLVGNELIYTTTLTGTQNVPFPGTSSTVGRIKMSEDNNPMPRDRWIFAYDHFDNVPFTPDGIQVNRFQFGFEKTFLDGQASFEVRLPFAGTLASTNVQGQEVTDMELGNLRFALKYLWTNSDTWHFSTGIAATLPTANDVTLLSSDPSSPTGTVPFYKLRNQSVQVEPFAALLYTPNDRFFSQLWGSVNFDATGGELTWNTNIFGGSGKERVWDLPILAIDYQIGYWLFRNEFSTFRGLAPFVELHYNYIIAQDVLNREVRDELGAQGLTFRSVGDHELNLTAGATAQIGNNMNISVGGTAPLLKTPNRLFDAQFGLRVNYFFGRTARERSVASQVSGF